MHLPEELLDEILSYLPPYDKRSLQRYSLVSKSWLEPSRRLLFAHISIRVDNYHSWLDNISPADTRLLRHVRSLDYFELVPASSWAVPHQTSAPRNGINRRVYVLQDYFPSFSQLQMVVFRNMDVDLTIPGHLKMFSAFKYTLSSLSFIRGSITWSTFVGLIG
jgi:hypothetical protein